MTEAHVKERELAREALWRIIEKAVRSNTSESGRFLRELIFGEKGDAVVSAHVKAELVTFVALQLTEGGDFRPPNSSEVSTEAKEKYALRKNRSESPVQFLQRVWARELESEALYQFQLRTLDPELLTGLKSYCQKRKLKVSQFLPGRSEFVKKRHEAELQNS